jgi:bloom syndrome protein
MELGYLREAYPHIPLMACTATATPSVLHDIKQVLHLEKAPCHMGSFDRPNIFYKVKYRDSLDVIRPGGAMGDLINFVKKQHKRADTAKELCSGIIYVHTRQQTTEIAREIHERCGIMAVAYHAGLKVADRNNAQDAWTSGEAQVAVATVAFGMGIDLGHVRYVVHWTISKSIEAFYQESGRAGRDGLPSISVVYFSKDDSSKYRFLLSTKQTKQENVEPSVRDIAALEKMEQYCTEPGCRRICLLNHFGEVMKDPKCICEKSCDFCKNPDGVKRAIESASSAKDFTLHTSEFVATSRKNAFVSRSYDDDVVEKPFSVGGLGVTEAGGSSDFDEGDSDLKPKANFTKASEILSKYEVSIKHGIKYIVSHC